MISASDLDSAFPTVDPGIEPLGNGVLVQLRLSKTRTESGIVIARATKEFNDSIAQFAKIISIGPLAFRNRLTGEVWPGGAWADVGDIVRCPKYGGDRVAKTLPNGDVVIFVIFEDRSLTGKVKPDHLSALDELV